MRSGGPAPNREKATGEMISESIGDVELASKLFGDKQEITWLKDSDWEYTRMTLTRDGRIDWKDEDTYDHDTTCFTGSYSLSGTEAEFTVTARGESSAFYDRYKDTQSAHHKRDSTESFSSKRFTGEGFSVTRK